MRKKKWVGIFATITGIIATMMGALLMIEQVRLVHILFLFFGGFGCGAGLVRMIYDLKKGEKSQKNQGI